MTNIVWTQSALQTLELVYLQTLQYTKNERIAAKLHNKLIKESGRHDVDIEFLHLPIDHLHSRP